MSRRLLSGSGAWPELRRLLAEALAKSRVDTTDEIMVLSAFLSDLGAGASMNPRAVRREWGELSGGLAARAAKLEVVFPFCPQKCLYCFLGTRAAPDAARLLSYLRDLQSEMRYLAPAFRGAVFNSLWLGRGTPSLLSAERLRELMRSLRENFSWNPRGLAGLECHPSTVDAGQLSALREMGFNHVSFGVESLDPDVLRRVGRGGQEERHVRDAVSWSRRAGFDDLNLDLVFGLAQESVESFLRGFRRLAELRPDTVTICSLTLTAAYAKALGVGREAHLRRMEAMLPSAVEKLQEAAAACGYEGGPLRPDQGVWRLISKETPRPVRQKWERSEASGAGMDASCLSLGWRGRSRISGRLLYQRLPRTFAPGRPIYRAKRLSARESMALYLLESLNLNSHVEFEAFRRRFGQDARKGFASELGLLSRLGRISADAAGFSFLPVRHPERIFYASVFLWETLGRGVRPPSRLRRLKAELEREFALC